MTVLFHPFMETALHLLIHHLKLSKKPSRLALLEEYLLSPIHKIARQRQQSRILQDKRLTGRGLTVLRIVWEMAWLTGKDTHWHCISSEQERARVASSVDSYIWHSIFMNEAKDVFEGGRLHFRLFIIIILSPNQAVWWGGFLRSLQ